MAEIVLRITLGLTLVRTFLVFDAVLAISGHGCGVSRIAQAAGSILSQTSLQGREAAPSQPVCTSWGRPPGAGPSKVRFLHVALLGTHVITIIGMVAAVLTYGLPVSDSSCRVTHAVFETFIVLEDASLLTFLLAKVNVTNGSRSLACWEKMVVWISRAYAWVYLPVDAVRASVELHAEADDKGPYCEAGYNTHHDEAEKTKEATRYATINALVTIQFVLLLGLFVRPLLGRSEATQSGGAVYRKVVIRNVVCTVAIVLSYFITTVTVVVAMLAHDQDDDTASQVVDSAPFVNQLVILCLIEISLPLGFTSCWKAFKVGLCPSGSSAKGRSVDSMEGTGNTNTDNGSGNNRAVIPVELLPQIP